MDRKCLIYLAPQVGFEPTTLRLTAECSTVELLRSNTGRILLYYTIRLSRVSNSGTPDPSTACARAAGTAPSRADVRASARTECAVSGICGPSRHQSHASPPNRR